MFSSMYLFKLLFAFSIYMHFFSCFRMNIRHTYCLLLAHIPSKWSICIPMVSSARYYFQEILRSDENIENTDLEIIFFFRLGCVCVFM